MRKPARFQILPAVLVGLLLCVAGVLWPRTEYRRPLTVAVNIWPGSEGLLMAREALRAKGERINLVEMSWSTAAMGAFHKHVVDAAIVTPDELLRLEDEGAEPQAVLVLGISKGSDAILARPGLSSMQDIRGKRVGVELRSMAEYLLLHALVANGMTLQDVKVVPLNMAETETAYDEREVDAVIAADPWRTRLQDKGATVLYDSGQLGLELSRVLVVREDALPDFSHEVRVLVAAHFEHMAQLDGTSGVTGLDAILRREGLTAPQWRQALGQIQVPDAAENRRLLAPGAGGLAECLEQMRGVMRRAGFLTHGVKVRTPLNATFVTERKP